MDKVINRRMIVLAREACGMRQTELAAAIDVTQSKISKYENGTLPVSDGDLALIAEVLAYTVEFFYQPDQDYGLGTSYVFHRKRKNVPVIIQKKIHAQVNILRMKIDRLLRSVDIEPPNTFPSLDVDEYDGKPEKVAAALRTIWKVPDGPIVNVTALIESAGGIVLHVPFDTRLIDAVHLWAPGLPPMFFVNDDLPGDRLRWTLAHEIGHAVMHRAAGKDVEQQANEFSSEFLMPRKEVRGHLVGLTLERAAMLKPYWKVSMAALIRRACDLNSITARKYKSLMTSLGASGYRTTEPYPVPVEEPKLLEQIYESHLNDLGYDQVDLERMLFAPVGTTARAILPFAATPVPRFYHMKDAPRRKIS